MPEEAEANAYLIAAAPELLAACKIAYAAWCDGTDAADWDALALRDAIAKAEGFIDPKSGGFTRCKDCGRDIDREESEEW